MLRKYFGLFALSTVFLTLFNCANPVDKEPLKWRSAIEVPVTNQNFNLKEQLDSIFTFDTMKIYDPDSTHPGDILQFVQTMTDTTMFEAHSNNIDTQTYHATLGVFPLVNVPLISVTSPLPATVGNFSAQLPVTLDKVYQVTFYDTSVNMLPVTITNNSASPLTNVTIGIVNADTQVIASIGANASAVANLNVRGKTLGQIVNISVSGTSATAGVKQLGLSFSLNGLIVSRCKIDDHLVNIKETFFGTYDITDTVAMDYIDIADGFFYYKISNNTGLEFRVNVEHEHLWQTSYCEINGLETEKILNSFKGLDSLRYSGDITASGINVPPTTNQTVSKSNFSSNRMFTLWDPVRKKTYTSIKYDIATVPPRGDTLTLTANDALDFTVYVQSFKFKDFVGTTMEDCNRVGDTQKIAINLPKPWNQSVMDSLRGKFIFKKVYGRVHITTDMPNQAYMDTLGVNFTAIAHNSPADMDSTATQFVNVRKDATYDRTLDITRVTNAFPDTIVIKSNVRVPKGTHMKVCNDLTTNDRESYLKYIGQMTVKIKVNYALSPNLDWRIADTVNLDLGSGRFTVINALRMIRKLENRRVLMDMRLTNNSNLFLKLYALIAPKSQMTAMDSLSTNEFVNLATHNGLAEKKGFVNFLSSDGILIPRRSMTDTSTILLDNDQLETILSSDTCGWRWLAKLIKTDSSDALTDTDYVKVKSLLHFDGTNSTDSMIIW